MSLAQLNQSWYKVFYTFCTQNIQCLPFNHYQSWSSSMHVTFLKSPQRFPFTYQTHDLIVVIQTETFQRHRLSTNKHATRKEKNTEIQREKGENSSVVHLADDILCTLSVISFSSVKMDRISPPPLSLSLSGMTASLKSLETPFSSVSLTSLSLPLSGCYFPETLWISYNPFFFPHLLSYFFISAWARIQHLPLDKLSVSLSIHLSNSTCLDQRLSGKKNNIRWNWEKKII